MATTNTSLFSIKITTNTPPTNLTTLSTGITQMNATTSKMATTNTSLSSITITTNTPPTNLTTLSTGFTQMNATTTKMPTTNTSLSSIKITTNTPPTNLTTLSTGITQMNATTTKMPTTNTSLSSIKITTNTPPTNLTTLSTGITQMNATTTKMPTTNTLLSSIKITTNTPPTTDQQTTMLTSTDNGAATGFKATPSRSVLASSKSQPASASVNFGCSLIPSVQGRTMTPSSGPYLPNITRVTFTCLNGLTLSGSANIMCTSSMTWSEEPPQCTTTASNYITLGDVGEVPLWLAIILGITFAVLCLFLLTCFAVYCCKLCGFCDGTVASVSVDGVIGRRGNRYVGCLCCKQKVQAKTKNSSTSVVDLEQVEIQDSFGYRHDSSKRRFEMGKPPLSHQFAGNGQGRGSTRRKQTNTFNREYELGFLNSQKKRLPAKKPDTWLPHANSLRNVNTSTK